MKGVYLRCGEMRKYGTPSSPGQLLATHQEKLDAPVAPQEENVIFFFSFLFDTVTQEGKDDLF